MVNLGLGLGDGVKVRVKVRVMARARVRVSKLGGELLHQRPPIDHGSPSIRVTLTVLVWLRYGLTEVTTDCN